MAQGPSGLFSPVSPALFSGLGDVREIQYTLTAWNESDCVQEHFRHPVKNRMRLGASGLSRTGAIKLFMAMPLNDILATRKFSKVKGLQFIC